jgi:hypothetical protein
MHCLQDYIGLRGCGTTTPPSGLYINDLPGISLKQLVALTNEEEATYVDLWNMIQRRAQNRFNLDVRQAMGNHYKMKSLLQGINLGNVIGSTTTASTDYLGFTIELIESPDYQYVPSPLASIHIQDLYYYAPPGQGILTVDLHVQDINTGQVLWNEVANVTDGWNTIPVNTTFHNNYAVNSWQLVVYFDTLNAQTVVDMNLPFNHTIPGCCDVRIQGAAFDSGQPVTYSSSTSGLSGTFTIVCNWESLICQNKTVFSRAYWFLLGIELLTEQLYSTKLNQFTTVNLQRCKELREEYQVEYMKALEQIAGGFKLACDCCIECNEQVQLRETTQFY